MTGQTLGQSPKSADANEEAAFFRVLRRRHACRNFEHREVPDEMLQKLAYAAHRAPTSGNAAYRFVIVVKNQVQLRLLKMVSPGYFGDTSAAIIVCTDTSKAYKGRGGQSEILCSMYDAGAAAENVVLAAYSMGLGASFIKSYSELALAKILELPEGCRTELVVSVGFPAADEPKPLKKRRGSTMTFVDKYGLSWDSKEIPMTHDFSTAW